MFGSRAIIAYLIVLREYRLSWASEFEQNIRDYRKLAMFQSVICLIEMFRWLRLFDRTSKYVNLIQETFYGIYHFTWVLFVIILIFTFPFYLLNMNNFDNSQDPILSDNISTKIPLDYYSHDEYEYYENYSIGVSYSLLGSFM